VRAASGMLNFYCAKEMPMWTLESPWYELVIRGSVIYFFMFTLMRIWGRKHLGEVTAFDFILLLFISEAVQNSLVDDDKSLLGGMIVIVTFLFWNTLINILSYKFRFMEKIFSGNPKVIVKDGKINHYLKHKEHMSDQELFSALRQEGVEDLAKVKKATIETNGHMSVVQEQ
jgi:uncharacterized membrane protein YcaP (DUF421 family)